MTRRAFLSSPVYNDPQIKGHSIIGDALRDAGFDVANPNALSAFKDGSGKEQKDPAQLMSERESLLQKSDLVVAWMDLFQLKGFKVLLLRNIQRDVTIPLPPPLINLIAAGLQATGQAQIKPKSGLIVPGRDDPRGVEIANCPRQLNLSAHEMGGIFGQVAAGPLNFPDTLVAAEAGAASALGKPLILVATAAPAVGLIASKAELIVPTFDDLPEAFQTFAEHFDNPDVRKKECEALMKRYHEEARKRAEERQRLLKEEIERQQREAAEATVGVESPPAEDSPDDEEPEDGKVVAFPGK